MLPDEIKAGMQGIIPSHVVTCAKDGTPNITCISQVFYVDPTHVALSFQFFNKTLHNLRENPLACVQIITPRTHDVWILQLRFERSEKEGPLYDQMAMQLEAIASAQRMQDVFSLQGADIYEVLSARKLVEARAPK
jgi:predicted pyridoxine 5'-phosphate oxidase superfamily flavin-nucleotide-binding protein